MPYYIYLLQCCDKTLYTGITTDPERRFLQHCGRLPGGARYTRARKAEALYPLFLSQTRTDATRLEYHLRRLSHEQKLLLLQEPCALSTLLGKKLDCSLYEVCIK